MSNNETWLDLYLKYTQGQESPELFHKWVGISLIAATLERNVWIDRGFYKLFPNLYVILIAASASCRKSTAAEIGTGLLGDALPLSSESLDGIRLFHGRITLPKLVKDLGGMRLDKQTGKYISNSRLYIFAPEMAVFLSGQEVPEMVQFLTDFYGCKTGNWSYRTKTQGEVDIVNPCINFLGCSTSEWLARGITNSDFGGGFVGRCLFVVQRASGKKIAFPSMTDEQQQLKQQLEKRLVDLRRFRGEIVITKSAVEFYTKWYESRSEIAEADRLKGYYERKSETVLKLSIIRSAMIDRLTVDIQEIKWALGSLEEIEKYQKDAFQFIGTDENTLSELLLAHLELIGGKSTYAALLSFLSPRLKGYKQFEEVLCTLDRRGLIERYVRGNQERVALKDKKIHLHQGGDA